MSEAQRRHETYMREALVLAERAASIGEVPVGCVIVQNNEIIGQGWNTIQRDADPTSHAELMAISQALRSIEGKYLGDATLYVTIEPCAMCAGAILLSKVGTVVYGAPEPKSGAVRSVYDLLDSSKTNHHCTVKSGVLEEECAAVMSAFFEQQRKANKEKTLQDSASTIGEPSTEHRGSLCLIPTPIGNLGDITRRAIEQLQHADVVYCEDTRQTGKLLKLLGVHVHQLLSNHEHNERQRADEIVMRVQSGQTVAIVSDAGMPGVSDPGFRAVQACTAAGLVVTALPGASAAVTALAASGLSPAAWYFAGFPPQKKGRSTFVKNLAARTETVVLYESPYRIVKLLEELQEFAGASRKVVVARELTKLHEEYVRGTVSEVLSIVKKRSGLKGECVVLVEGKRIPDIA